MAASSNVDEAVATASEASCSSENDKVCDSDIPSRFGLNMGFSDFLQSWGFLNLSPFRRKSSRASTLSPQKQVPLLPTITPDLEHIELVQFSNIKVRNVGEEDCIAIDEETTLRDSTLPWPQEEVENLEVGMGHDFSPSDCCYPTWCDKCGDMLWGIYETSYFRCRYCHYTCHPHCRSLVTLDCQGDGRGAATLEDEQPVEHVVGLEEIVDPCLEPLLQEASSEEDGGTSLQVSPEQLKTLINEYNAANTSGLDMTLEEDGTTFRGFIRVHMNLCRPISVAAGTRPPSIYDILKDDETLDKTLTSFYLPRDTVKALHVTSETTTHEVIKALLKKFRVVDNPQKFALYERYYEHGETAKVKMRRIAETERPLVLALRWSREQNCNKMFVLQENETGDILWDAFTLPELNNFLRILDREEEEYKRVVRQKYHFLGKKIQEAMERLKPSEDSSPGHSRAS